MSLDLAPLKKLAKKSPELFKKAQSVAGIQFLTWANLGTSGKSSKKPPIKWAILRGSSSVFIGNELLQIFVPAMQAGELTPARSHTAPFTTLTFVWNTDYAKKMHEWTGNWGKVTLQDGNAGNKWLEDHLAKDKDSLMDTIAIDFKKRAGT